MRGLFISFEGSEGCGKSTQIARLNSALEAGGHRCLIVREPGGTATGEAVREILLRHSEGEAELTAPAELLLFAASRAQLVREKIGPALEAGTHVIADRFHDSTTVYQGFGRGIDLIAVSQINAFATGRCLPELTFLLDMEPAAAHARALERSGGRLDRIESEDAEFYERVRAGYLQVAHENARRITVLDAARPPDELTDAIRAVVDRHLRPR